MLASRQPCRRTVYQRRSGNRLFGAGDHIGLVVDLEGQSGQTREADRRDRQRWLRLSVKTFQAAAVKEGRSAAGGDWWREVVQPSESKPSKSCQTPKTHWQSIWEYCDDNSIYGHPMMILWSHIVYHKGNLSSITSQLGKNSKMMKSTSDKVRLYNNNNNPTEENGNHMWGEKDKVHF